MADQFQIVISGSDIAHANILYYPMYYDIISLTSLKITQAFGLLLFLQKIKSSLGILYFEIAFG